MERVVYKILTGISVSGWNWYWWLITRATELVLFLFVVVLGGLYFTCAEGLHFSALVLV